MMTLRDLTTQLDSMKEALAGLRYDLLLWLKSREIGAHSRAHDADMILDEEDKAHYLGRFAAYRDAWRQILWPGKAVEDETLDEEEFQREDAFWRKKAEESRARIMSEPMVSPPCEPSMCEDKNA